MENVPRPVSHVKTDSLSEAEQRKLDRARERETIIRFDDADPLAHVSTCHEWVADALQRRGARPARAQGRRKGRCWTFEVPKEWFRVPAPPKKRPRLSQEYRRAASERLALLKSQNN